jgi:hypothetical protein
MKARELSVGDLMDVLVLRAAKDTVRPPNAAEAAEVPAEAAANGVVVAGVFDLYIHNIYICAMYQTCFVCRRTFTGAVEAEEPSDGE